MYGCLNCYNPLHHLMSVILILTILENVKPYFFVVYFHFP